MMPATESTKTTMMPWRGWIDRYMKDKMSEDNYNTQGNCSGLAICMNRGSEWTEIVAENIPESYIVEEDNVTEILQGFRRRDSSL